MKKLKSDIKFLFLKKPKNLNSDFLGFLRFFEKNLKNLGFLKTMSNSPDRYFGRPTWITEDGRCERTYGNL